MKRTDADITTARELLGDPPETPIEDGLQKFADWVADYYAGRWRSRGSFESCVRESATKESTAKKNDDSCSNVYLLGSLLANGNQGGPRRPLVVVWRRDKVSRAMQPPMELSSRFSASARAAVAINGRMS